MPFSGFIRNKPDSKSVALDGTAVAGDILLGKTAYVTHPKLKVAGIMPNKVGSATVLTPSGADIIIPQGYFSGAIGDGKVAAVVVPAANVLTGTTIAGTAGIMPNKVGSATVLTPSGADIIIPQGYFSGAIGDGKVAAVVVPAANVLTGTTIAGTAGTMPNRVGPNAGTLYPSAGNLDVVPPVGYYDGTTGDYVHMPDINFIAANILSGKTIFGVAGTAIDGAGLIKYARGSQTIANYAISVSGLTFTPKTIVVTYISANWDVYRRAYSLHEVNSNYNLYPAQLEECWHAFASPAYGSIANLGAFTIAVDGFSCATTISAVSAWWVASDISSTY